MLIIDDNGVSGARAAALGMDIIVKLWYPVISFLMEIMFAINHVL